MRRDQSRFSAAELRGPDWMAGLNRTVSEGVGLYSAAVDRQIGRWRGALEKLGSGRYGLADAIEDTRDYCLDSVRLGIDLSGLWWEAVGDCLRRPAVAWGPDQPEGEAAPVEVAITGLYGKVADMADKPQVTATATVHIRGAENGAVVHGRFSLDGKDAKEVSKEIKGGTADLEVTFPVGRVGKNLDFKVTKVVTKGGKSVPFWPRSPTVEPLEVVEVKTIHLVPKVDIVESS